MISDFQITAINISSAPTFKISQSILVNGCESRVIYIIQNILSKHLNNRYSFGLCDQIFHELLFVGIFYIAIYRRFYLNILIYYIKDNFYIIFFCIFVSPFFNISLNLRHLYCCIDWIRLVYSFCLFEFPPRLSAGILSGFNRLFTSFRILSLSSNII